MKSLTQDRKCRNGPLQRLFVTAFRALHRQVLAYLGAKDAAPFRHMAQSFREAAMSSDPCDILAEKADASRQSGQESARRSQESRLSGPRSAEQRGDLTGRDGK